MHQSAQRPNRVLRERRLRAGLSQRALARVAGVAPNSIRNAELGGLPFHDTQRRIAEALGVDRFELWPLVEDDEELAA